MRKFPTLILFKEVGIDLAIYASFLKLLLDLFELLAGGYEETDKFINLLWSLYLSNFLAKLHWMTQVRGHTFMLIHNLFPKQLSLELILDFLSSKEFQFFIHFIDKFKPRQYFSFSILNDGSSGGFFRKLTEVDLMLYLGKNCYSEDI